MPGDPKECRAHAKRCLRLAKETTIPALKDSLTGIAQQWVRIAADLDNTKRLLEALGELQSQTGCISELESDGFRHLAENIEAISTARPTKARSPRSDPTP